MFIYNSGDLRMEDSNRGTTQPLVLVFIIYIFSNNFTYLDWEMEETPNVWLFTAVVFDILPGNRVGIT